MLLVLFVQLSKSPFRSPPTFTDPPTKHWSQLLVANAGFVVHATLLYSPRDDPIEAATAVVTAAGFGAAVRSGVADADTGVTAAVPVVDPVSSAADTVVIANILAKTTTERSFCMGRKVKM